MAQPGIHKSIADREQHDVADRSASLDFGTVTWEKQDLVLAAAAGVGFLTSRGGNRIGAVISGSHGAVTVPARQGRKHLLSILHQIQGAPRADAARGRSGRNPQTGGVGVTTAIARGRDLGLARGPRDVAPHAGNAERAPRSLAVEVLDPRELDLPRMGVLTLIDTESGRTHEIDTNNRGLRERYATAAAEQRSDIRLAIAGSGARPLTPHQTTTGSSTSPAASRRPNAARPTSAAPTGSCPVDRPCRTVTFCPRVRATTQSPADRNTP